MSSKKERRYVTLRELVNIIEVDHQNKAEDFSDDVHTINISNSKNNSP
jgi:hypothetical protein